MGCFQSKIDHEESVIRCGERKRLMEDVVQARNRFASSHSGYVVALKNTGAALSDYAHGEHDGSETEAPQADIVVSRSPPHNSQRSSVDNVLPPPPPLPVFSPSPIIRTVSLPEASLEHEAAIPTDEEELSEVEKSEIDKKKRLSLDRQSSRPALKTKSLSQRLQPSCDGGREVKNGAWDFFFDSGHATEDDEAGDDFNHGSNNNERIEGFSRWNTRTRQENEDEKEENYEDDKANMNHKGLLGAAVVEFMQLEEKRNKSGSVISMNLLQVLSSIDDLFLKASESAQDVSKLLEATKLHYHSNFADDRGQIKHGDRIIRAITWNKSLRGVGCDNGMDESDDDEDETHATVLDKLSGWEKKLFDEVKVAEAKKITYMNKLMELNRQKGSNDVLTLEKTKSEVKQLLTSYMVDMQSVETIIAEVNLIRDQQLYPKLIVLVEETAKMWESMRNLHENQLNVVTCSLSADLLHSPKETTQHHHGRTLQLLRIVEAWESQFNNLIQHQKQYVETLGRWLQLNLVPMENNSKENTAMSAEISNPPILRLLQNWQHELHDLPHEEARSGISTFAEAIKSIIKHQEEEIKLKHQCEETNKELLRQNEVFQEWYRKHVDRRPQNDPVTAGGDHDPVSDRRSALEDVRKKLEGEMEDHNRLCLLVRDKSRENLEISLPKLFVSLSVYARCCSSSYANLAPFALEHSCDHDLRR